MFRINQDLNSSLPKYTGKHLVKLNPRSQKNTIRHRAEEMSLKLACFDDYKDNIEAYHEAFKEGDGIFFNRCGVAVINSQKEEEIARLTTDSKSRDTFYYYEPERYVYALNDSFKEYLRGYKSAVDHIYEQLVNRPDTSKISEDDFHDNDKASWGIQATKVLDTEWTGKDAKLAILDTGFNYDHPDFKDRKVESKSFVEDEKADDGNGHGTHCTGIAAGNKNKETGRRYGVAKEAAIFIGKVLSDKGSGSDSNILAGIEWAMSEDCQVVSMSLGAPVEKGDPYSDVFNDLAKKALNQGTLIIAAAGNESRRDMGKIAPVGHPANCPAIMAVAALDNSLKVAPFSNGSVDSDGGQIDLAAPGVDIYSSWKSPQNYNTISGTSMATPFVSGMAALYWQANPEASASEIRTYLTQNAKRLDQPSSDVGNGIIRPPEAE